MCHSQKFLKRFSKASRSSLRGRGEVNPRPLMSCTKITSSFLQRFIPSRSVTIARRPCPGRWRLASRATHRPNLGNLLPGQNSRYAVNERRKSDLHQNPDVSWKKEPDRKPRKPRTRGLPGVSGRVLRKTLPPRLPALLEVQQVLRLRTARIAQVGNIHPRRQ